MPNSSISKKFLKNTILNNKDHAFSGPKLSTEQFIVIQHLRDLFDIKCNACTLYILSEEDIDMLIREVAKG